MPSDPNPKLTLDYALPEQQSSKDWKVVLGFAAGTLVGGIAGTACYNFLLNPNPKDDSLLILIELLAIQLAVSFCIFTVAVWSRLRKGNRSSPRAAMVAGLVGLAYGTIPAAGFASPFPSVPTVDVAGLILMTCPVALPFLLFRRQRRADTN